MMQFIAFWEFAPQDSDKYIDKLKQMTAERQKGTQNSPKIIFGPCLFDGEYKGFSVYETDDPERLMNLAIFYSPELKAIKFKPIIESSRFADLFSKVKRPSPSTSYG